jgi:hypothetical protein
VGKGRRRLDNRGARNQEKNNQKRRERFPPLRKLLWQDSRTFGIPHRLATLAKVEEEDRLPLLRDLPAAEVKLSR